jgi:adenylosuccinate synthase
MMRQLNVITDLQFGSCGKGLYAGWLAKKTRPDTLITAWMPNAGHTFVDAEGNKLMTCALPSGLVSDSVQQVLVGPGSVINPSQFATEMIDNAHLMEGVNVMIHESAAVVTEEHRAKERSYGFKFGSTMKGCGEAIQQKIRRIPDENNTAGHQLIGTPLEGFLVTADEYNRALDKSEVAQLEGAQGFSLSINQGFYPYTTSRDCTTHALLSDCAIPHRTPTTVHGVCRFLPIRVANRYDKTTGLQIGTSGPCYPDQRELTWEEVGQPVELTTVTQLPRRIFTWSKMQIDDAIRMNGVNHIFLNFVNYARAREDLYPILDQFARLGFIDNIMFGVGPKETDVVSAAGLVERMGW